MSEPCLHIDFTCCTLFLCCWWVIVCLHLRSVGIPDCALIRHYLTHDHMKSGIPTLCIFLNKHKWTTVTVGIEFSSCAETWPQNVPNRRFGEPLHPHWQTPVSIRQNTSVRSQQQDLWPVSTRETSGAQTPHMQPIFIICLCIFLCQSYYNYLHTVTTLYVANNITSEMPLWIELREKESETEREQPLPVIGFHDPQRPRWPYCLWPVRLAQTYTDNTHWRCTKSTHTPSQRHWSGTAVWSCVSLHSGLHATPLWP